MESIIDEKIYELSVKEDNFDLVFDINQRYDSIIERLQFDFWNELAEYMKIKSQEKVEREDDWLISLRNQKVKNLKIYVEWQNEESITYGVLIDNLKNRKQTNLIFNSLTDFLIDFDSKMEGKSVDFFKDFDYDFSKLHGLKKMIPVNRTKLFDDFFETIERLREQIQNHLPELEILLISD
jgi:hypothetical protein